MGMFWLQIAAKIGSRVVCQCCLAVVADTHLGKTCNAFDYLNQHRKAWYDEYKARSVCCLK